MDNGWKELFPPWILERAMTYRQLGRVVITEYDGCVLRADVLGNEMYHVSILFSRGIPEHFTCTCPHAEKGWLCKHMAAALLEAEKLERNPENHGQAQWEMALNALTSDVARLALRYLAEQNPDIQEMILTLYRGSMLAEPE